jgi:hypothetical protein
MLCGGCRNRGTGFKQCAGCKVINYCSSECQKSHWKEHKPTCKRITEYLQKNSNVRSVSTKMKRIMHEKIGEYIQQMRIDYYRWQQSEDVVPKIGKMYWKEFLKRSSPITNLVHLSFVDYGKLTDHYVNVKQFFIRDESLPVIDEETYNMYLSCKTFDKAVELDSRQKFRRLVATTEGRPMQLSDLQTSGEFVRVVPFDITYGMSDPDDTSGGYNSSLTIFGVGAFVETTTNVYGTFNMLKYAVVENRGQCVTTMLSPDDDPIKVMAGVCERLEAGSSSSD